MTWLKFCKFSVTNQWTMKSFDIWNILAEKYSPTLAVVKVNKLEFRYRWRSSICVHIVHGIGVVARRCSRHYTTSGRQRLCREWDGWERMTINVNEILIALPLLLREYIYYKYSDIVIIRSPLTAEELK